MGGLTLRAPNVVDFDEWRYRPDPFGAGVEFAIYRTDSRHHEAWTDEQHRTNPLLVRVGFLSATLEERLDFAQLRARAFEELAKEGVSPSDLEIFNPLERSLNLLRGWRGLCDVAEDGATTPVPFSPEAARELLTNASSVIADGLMRGMNLGDALQLWIITEAQKHADERSSLLADLEKNYEASSGSAASLEA